MKKTIALLCIFMSLLSCEGPQGRPGRDGLVNYASLTYLVSANSSTKEGRWTYSNMTDNNYFVAELTVPELTAQVYDNGIVQVNVEYDFGKPSAAQTALPCTIWREEYVNDDNGGYYLSYADHYWCEYTVGKIYIYYQTSDFAYDNGSGIPVFTPSDTYFHIMLMW